MSVIVHLKGVLRGTSKTGKVYYYHRKTRTPLPGQPGTTEFMDALAKAEATLRSAAAMTAQSSRGKTPGTLGALIAAYKTSPEWRDRADRTKSDYQKIFDYLAAFDDVKIERFTTPFVYDLRDKTEKKRKRRFANYLVQVLRLLLSWAVKRGWNGMTVNPAKGVELVKRPKGMKEANRPWTVEELLTVLDAAPGGLRTAVALGAFAGMSEADVVSAVWSCYTGGRIVYRRNKTGVLVDVTAHTRLRAILDEAGERKEHLLIVLGARGKPLTEEGFRTNFFKLVQKLEKAGKVGPDLTFHGLRHTLGGWLAEAGCDPLTIASVLGHLTTHMAEHYSRRAKRQRLADDAMERFGEIVEEYARQPTAVRAEEA